MTPFLIFGAFAALIIVIGIFAYRAEKKRKSELLQWAESQDWEYSPGKRRPPRLPFSLMNRGNDRYSRFHAEKIFTDATAGLDAASVELFEHHYSQTSGSGKDRKTHHYHNVCASVSPGIDLGSIEIRPEGFGDKIAQAVGFDDIDFEDHEFSKKFVVKAKDRKQAYDLCDQRMMTFLLANRGWKIKTAGRQLLIHKAGRASAGVYTRIAVFAVRFLAELPRHVVNAERERRGLKPLIEAGNAALHHRTEEE